MDIKYLEFAAEKFFEMCREHPEICPHDYHWTRTTSIIGTDECRKYYVCGLCGKETYEVIFDE